MLVWIVVGIGLMELTVLMMEVAVKCPGVCCTCRARFRSRTDVAKIATSTC